MMLLPPVSSPLAPSDSATDLIPHFAEETLANGLHLRFYDQTNRYFGDYHRVRILVEIELALNNPLLVDQDLLLVARERFGSVVTSRKILERMGVPSARVEDLRSELIASYQLEVQNYLARPDVPQRLLQAELANKASRTSQARRR